MWRTNGGERKLEGAEAVVFATALQDLIDEVNLNEIDDYDLGIEVFDSLTYGQKIQSLYIVSKGLLTDEPIVKLTAVLEGTVDAVFQHLRNEVAVEVDKSCDRDSKYKNFYREKILTARKKSEGEELPLLDCENVDIWEIEIDCLEELILWDDDYSMGESFLDLSPENSKKIKGIAGVADGYYAAIVDDPKPEKVKELRDKINKLCQAIN